VTRIGKVQRALEGGSSHDQENNSSVHRRATVSTATTKAEEKKPTKSAKPTDFLKDYPIPKSKWLSSNDVKAYPAGKNYSVSLDDRDEFVITIYR
jgi:hypothetical protein